MNSILLAGGSAFSLITPDPGLLIWTVLIFVTLWILLGKFAFKPIANALKEREQDIEDSLHQAEKAREEMAQMTAKNEELLNEAKEERSKIIKEAKEAGEQLREEIKEKASAEAKVIVENAKREIETQKKAALVEVKNEVGSMALNIAEQILRKELAGNEDQEKYVAKLVEDADLN